TILLITLQSSSPVVSHAASGNTALSSQRLPLLNSIMTNLLLAFSCPVNASLRVLTLVRFGEKQHTIVSG
ncbi:MAG: hypothetical protein LBF42_01925, partial [Puniceicoccales bacterium]|nr:hypothetical protein [Puniceicoccales bacterium]